MKETENKGKKEKDSKNEKHMGNRKREQDMI